MADPLGLPRVGFAVVGLGMGANRARLVRQTPGARLAAVVDLDRERAERVTPS